MSAERSAVAAPVWAITIWCDLTRIYVQLPSAHGPCVVPYPRDARGVSEVLALMKTRHETEGLAKAYRAPLNPLAKAKVPISEASREQVREMLRRKGIIGGKNG